ncbi:MAG TPA: aldehyde ferredoxin oxidoreductase family protein [Firmicutes bacterium]|nr:aldehyde ferredoxin oxidoreductase family protein [Bacillota bacterium]
MHGGYMGRVLRVDLTQGAIEQVELSEEEARTYIGGSGLGAALLYRETGPETDPLGPDNLLLFFTGPLTGTKVFTSGRYAVVTRSPLTGIWAEADAGGKFGPRLKAAGFDGIAIKGRAAAPVYLYVDDGRAELRPAAGLWGKDTYVTEELIREQTAPDVSVACIGPAGENQVLIAGIMSEGSHGRAAGRAGVGAVMGSKNLKAVAVRGSQRVKVARPAELESALKAFAPGLVEASRGRHLYGTAGGVVSTEKIGDFPLQNWRRGTWPEGAAKISGQVMAETMLTGRYYCDRCPIGCGREVKADTPWGHVEGAGPEYETIGMLGGMCLVDSLPAIAYGNELCNRYGLDTISTGAAIAFAMECYEHGLITAADAEGLELTWGSAAAMLGLIDQIAHRRALGALLAEGTVRAAKKIGGLAPEFTVHSKGLEFPAHDPRTYNSLALGYATSNRGACHLQGFTHGLELSLTMPDLGFPEILDRFAAEQKGAMTAAMQNLMSLFDSLKVCKFLLWGGAKPHHVVEWLNLVTGWELDVASFIHIGERLFNLKRLYNVRLGVSRKDDTISPRILTLKKGGGAGDNLPPLGRMLSEYYEVRGWTEEGIPRPETLVRLGLADFAPAGAAGLEA